MIQPLPVLNDGTIAVSQSTGKKALFQDATGSSESAFPQVLQDASILPESDAPIISEPVGDSHREKPISSKGESGNLPIDGQVADVPVDPDTSKEANNPHHVASDVAGELLPFASLVPLNPAMIGKFVPLQDPAGSAQVVSNGAQGLPNPGGQLPVLFGGMMDFAQDSLAVSHRSMTYLSNPNIQGEPTVTGTWQGDVNLPSGNTVAPHYPQQAGIPIPVLTQPDSDLPRWITDRIAASTRKQPPPTPHTHVVSSDNKPNQQSSASESRPVSNQLESGSTSQNKSHSSAPGRIQTPHLPRQNASLRIYDQGTIEKDFTHQTRMMSSERPTSRDHSDQAMPRNPEPVSSRENQIRYFAGQNMNAEMSAAARTTQVDPGLRFETMNVSLPQASAGDSLTSVSIPSVTQVTAGGGENISWGDSNTTATPLTEKMSSEESAFTQRVWRGLSTLLNQRGGIMNLRLDPPELGELRVQMSITQNHVTATFHAETAEAQALLVRSLGMLRTALEQQGLTVDRLHVQHTPSSQSEQLREDSNQEQNQNHMRHQHDTGDGRSRGRSDEDGASSGSQSRAADDLFTELLQSYNPGDKSE